MDIFSMYTSTLWSLSERKRKEMKKRKEKQLPCVSARVGATQSSVEWFYHVRVSMERLQKLNFCLNQLQDKGERESIGGNKVV